MSTGSFRPPSMETPPQTQVTTGSQRNYVWIILFSFDLDNESPFSCLSLDQFKGKDFPWNLISGHLGLSDRMKPRLLSRLPGPKYAVFAKVESGRLKNFTEMQHRFSYFFFRRKIKYFSRKLLFLLCTANKPSFCIWHLHLSFLCFFQVLVPDVGMKQFQDWTASTLRFYQPRKPFKNVWSSSARRNLTACSRIGLMIIARTLCKVNLRSTILTLTMQPTKFWLTCPKK